MKLNPILFCFILFVAVGCEQENLLDTPKYLEDSAVVLISDSAIVMTIQTTTFQDSLIRLEFERYKNLGASWYMEFLLFPMRSQTILLNNDSSGYAILLLGDPNPQIATLSYSLFQNNSVVNLLRVNVDTSTQELSGHFEVRFANSDFPFDAVTARCDTFSCKWP